MIPQIHTLNFVGRQTIEASKIAVSGFIGTSGAYITLNKFDVEEYNFEQSAKVVIEISHTTHSMIRIDAGELSALDPNNRYEIDIDADGINSAMVDINVVSTQPASRYKIIGTAKRLRLALDGRKVSILPHIDESLGGEVWRLGFNDFDMPVLLLSNRLEAREQVAESKEFQALVMPAVVEKIAEWLLKKLDDGDIEEPGVKKWKDTFFNLGCQLPDEDDVDERKKFPEQVAKAFATKFEFIEKYLESLEAREQ